MVVQIQIAAAGYINGRNRGVEGSSAMSTLPSQ